MSLRENMAYDAGKDEYTCQNGKKLKVVYTGKTDVQIGVLSQKSRITNARAVKAARTKRTAPGPKATGKCSFPRHFCGSVISLFGISHRKQVYF